MRTVSTFRVLDVQGVLFIINIKILGSNLHECKNTNFLGPVIFYANTFFTSSF